MNNSNELDQTSKLTDNMQLSKSVIFEILHNDRRRYMLEILHIEGSISVSSLSEEIALLEVENNESRNSSKKNVYDSLLNNHIPKMENLKIISYNREKDTVELLPSARQFDTYVETVKKGNISWSQFFFGLSTIALAGSITIYTGLIKWVTSFQWTLFICVLLLFSSIVFARYFHKQKRHLRF